MRIVGLTGGIASGKSTVSAQLQSQGFAVIDCDLLAKEVVRKVWADRLAQSTSNPQCLSSLAIISHQLRRRWKQSSDCAPLATSRGAGATNAWLQHLGATSFVLMVRRTCVRSKLPVYAECILCMRITTAGYTHSALVQQHQLQKTHWRSIDINALLHQVKWTAMLWDSWCSMTPLHGAN